MSDETKPLVFQLGILGVFLVALAVQFFTAIPSSVAMAYRAFLILTGLSAVLGLTRTTLLRSYLPSFTSSTSITVRLALRRLTQAVVAIVTVLSLLWLVDIDVSELFTALSIVAVAFVLVFKEYLTNFVATLYLLLTRRITLDDYIDTGTYQGIVDEITFQTVILRSLNDNTVVLPSLSLITSPYTKSTSSEQLTTEATVNLNPSTYDDLDNDAVQRRIEDTERGVEATVSVNGVQKDSIDVTLAATHNDPLVAKKAVREGLAFVAGRYDEGEKSDE